ncbi:MAG: hypothetical protein H0V92_05740 [Pseudonocardiales bacterium]|nr:hypothetical protein [Pseudonocardiales bacterium]
MTNTTYGALDVEPVSHWAPFDVRRPLIYDLAGARLDRLNALREPLTGVELGAYDRRILDWLANWDTPTIGTIASLLHRARVAGGAR